MIRVVIPYHLKSLAKVTGEIELDVPRPVTLKAVQVKAYESDNVLIRMGGENAGSVKKKLREIRGAVAVAGLQ